MKTICWNGVRKILNTIATQPGPFTRPFSPRSFFGWLFACSYPDNHCHLNRTSAAHLPMQIWSQVSVRHSISIPLASLFYFPLSVQSNFHLDSATGFLSPSFSYLQNINTRQMKRTHTLYHIHIHTNKYIHTRSNTQCRYTDSSHIGEENLLSNLFISHMHVGVCLRLLSLTSESWTRELKVERKKHLEVFLFQPRSTNVEGWITHFQPSTFSFTLAFNFQLFLSTWSWKWSWKATSLM